MTSADLASLPPELAWRFWSLYLVFGSILGLLIGSFLNVVIARLPDGRRAAANQASEAAFAELAAREPIGRRVRLETDAEGYNRFTFID